MREWRQGVCTGIFLAVVLLTGLTSYVQASQDGRPGEAQKKTEGQKSGKRVYTNEDLIQLRDKNKEKESTSSTVPPPDPSLSTAKGKGDERGVGLSSYRDVNGHDREYWRKKIKPLKVQLENLNSEIGTVRQRQADLGTTGGVRVSRDGHLKAPAKGSQQDLSRKLADLERKRDSTARSIQDLEEEARKAQALPEWLR